MCVLLVVLAGLLVVCGAVLCVIPVLPGPLVSFCGLLCLIPTDYKPSVPILVGFGIAVIVVTTVGYVVPAFRSTKLKCSNLGSWGSFVGVALGVFFFPIGLLVGPFLGAFVGELIAGQKNAQAARGGLNAILGILAGVVVRILLCVAMIAYFVRCLSTAA